MNKLSSLLLALFFAGCSASIQTQFQNPKPPLTLEDKVIFLDVHHLLPPAVEKIGTVSFGDSGFSTDCDFNSLLITARKIARSKGANIVKVTEKKAPNIWSTCYRLNIDLYFTAQEVSTLPQYQLQIN